MAENSSYSAFAAAGIPVKPADIRDELVKAWNAAAGDDVASDNSSAAEGRVRATLENLIVVASDDSSATVKKLNELITTLAIGHPSRFFIVAPRLDGVDELHTAVSSRCVLASSGEHLCTEEVYVAAAGESVGHVRNLILSLLVADVGTRMIVLGDPSRKEISGIVNQVAQLAERVIFDSRSFVALADSLQALESFWKKAQVAAEESSLGVSGEINLAEYVFRDINWRRLRRWRDLVREQFDRVCFEGAASQLEKVAFVSGKTGPQELSSDLLLLASWIARSLGLVLRVDEIEKLPDALKCVFAGENETSVSFEFRQNEILDHPGACSLKFEFAGKVPSLSLEEGEGEDGITISVGADEGDCDFDIRHVPLVAPSLEELVHADLISNSVGSEFEAVFDGASGYITTALDYFGDEMIRLAVSESSDSLRKELKAWLKDNRPPQVDGRLDLEEFVDISSKWQRKLADSHWVAVHWPEQYGGRGLSLVEEAVVQEELAEAGSPQLINLFGLTMVGPVLIKHGSEEQKKRYLSKILTAEEIWCQGFSEPEAGSDLASLRTSAVKDDNGWSLSGQKVWTSFAQYAHQCFVLARSNPDLPKHKGLSYFLCDMKTPGISVRPLTQISGDSEFNEVFFENVQVPDENIVGQPGDGWKIAISTLMYERVVLTFARHLQSEVALSEIKEMLNERGASESATEEFGRLTAKSMAVRTLALSHLLKYTDGSHPGPEGSLDKLLWSETFQEICEFAMKELGPDAVFQGGDDSLGDGLHQHRYLYSRGRTIAAGTSEIQRNIIADRILGLPRA